MEPYYPSDDPSDDRSPLRSGAATHTGRRRSLNEDYALVRRKLDLYLVCDGVGGENAGEVASSMAALSMCNFFESTIRQSWPDSYRALLDLTLAEPAKRLSAAIRKANADVHEMARTRPKQRNMNSTVVAAHFDRASRQMHVAHVGDSRCYRVRGPIMDQLTVDHSLRNEAILQKPDISAQQLKRIPKNVITRALGRRDTVEIDIQSLAAEPGDVFVLCSDGVNRMIPDRQILEAVHLAETPKDAAELLVELANDAGGIDNITAVVLQLAHQ